MKRAAGPVTRAFVESITDSLASLIISTCANRERYMLMTYLDGDNWTKLALLTRNGPGMPDGWISVRLWSMGYWLELEAIFRTNAEAAAYIFQCSEEVERPVSIGYQDIDSINEAIDFSKMRMLSPLQMYVDSEGPVAEDEDEAEAIAECWADLFILDVQGWIMLFK